MMTVNNYIAVLTAVLLLIFAVFAYSYKKGKILDHKILAAFLFANSLFLIDFSLPVIIKGTGINLSWFDGLGAAFGFLFGPLLYFYTLSLTRKDFVPGTSHLIHLILFVIIFFAELFGAGIPGFYFNVLLYLQTTPYMAACFILILKYRNRIKNYYSSIDKLNLTWMLYVVGAFFIMWIIDLTDFILINLEIAGRAERELLIFFSLLINFVFAVLIFYKALKHPEIFRGIPEIDKPQKYKKSRLTDPEKTEYAQKLIQFFDADKPFLNPDITITDVADSLDISVKYLSQVINESFNKNFYDFINSYRIEEAKHQFKENIDPKVTVLEVLYQSGFNSKSAFNAAFKKQTGCTPTQFRRRETISY